MEQNNPIAPVVNALPKGGIKKIWPYIVGSVLVVLIGVGTAWLISGKSGGRVSGASSVSPGSKSTSKEAGMLDSKVKYDTAEGILQEGGIGGEGTHHLVREGGPSKYVYLTSISIDMNNFVNKKVEIWGQTLSSKKSGWLMDVAKIKVTE